MSACTQDTGQHRCRLPAVRNGHCLAHQAPAPRAPTDPNAPTLRERVDRLIPELAARHPRKTPIAIAAQAWREVDAEST